MEENFFTLVKLEHAQKRLNEYTMETLDWVFEYWRLKRKSNKNEQLVREDDKEPEAANAEQRYRKITQLRTDLEKSRNLLCLIIKREKVKRQILRCEREIAIKELKFFGQKVQMSDNTAAELAKAETETETIKTEADVAANFLDELDDFSPRKEPEPKPKPTPTPKNKMKHRRAGPKSITRPNAPKAVPTFEQRKFLKNIYGIYSFAFQLKQRSSLNLSLSQTEFQFIKQPRHRRSQTQSKIQLPDQNCPDLGSHNFSCLINQKPLLLSIFQIHQCEPIRSPDHAVNSPFSLHLEYHRLILLNE